jgi:hypothetical protein
MVPPTGCGIKWRASVSSGNECRGPCGPPAGRWDPRRHSRLLWCAAVGLGGPPTGPLDHSALIAVQARSRKARAEPSSPVGSSTGWTVRAALGSCAPHGSVERRGRSDGSPEGPSVPRSILATSGLQDRRGARRPRRDPSRGRGSTRPSAAERMSTARGSMDARRSSRDAVTSRAASPRRRTLVAASSHGRSAREPAVASPTRSMPRPRLEAA